jgi:cell division protein FtsI/penicillin-binding protein 2
MSPRSFQSRCLLLCFLLVCGLSVLSVRLIQIQMWDRKKYAARARAAYDRSEVLPGLRGRIVDRHDEVLAKSIARSSVMVDAKLLGDPVVVVKALAYERAAAEPDWGELGKEDRARKLKVYRSMILDEVPAEQIVARHLARAVGVLARPLGLPRGELRRRIEEPMARGRQYFAVVQDLPEDDADRLRGLIAEHHLKGFGFENSIRRWYTSPDLASHVIGYTGETEVVGEDGDKRFRQTGKFGVEAAMEEYLHGQDGVWDYVNLPMPGEEGRMRPPVHGLNVRLTLDMGAQAIVEEELDAGLREFKSERGCVVLLDPHAGELLAMASRPNFNLNRKHGLTQGADFNYALQGTYEPGSTFKSLGVAAALNEGLVSPQTMIYCHEGLLEEGDLSIPDHSSYGMLSVSEVLKKSSNPGVFMVARKLGDRSFFRYVHDFGFGTRTGIRIRGEAPGLAHNTGNLIDFSRVTFGYAIGVTPLQMTAAYGVIANGGEWVRPRVVHSVIANDGTPVEQFAPEIGRRILKETVAAQMREILTTVTEEGGTATAAAVEGFRVAGKTGTAVRMKDGRYQEGHYTVSFIGMMPAQQPTFVCLVVIDDPRSEEVNPAGGTVAAPIFSRIATRLAPHLNLTPTEPVDPPAEPVEGSLVENPE